MAHSIHIYLKRIYRTSGKNRRYKVCLGVKHLVNVDLILNASNFRKSLQSRFWKLGAIRQCWLITAMQHFQKIILSSLYWILGKMLGLWTNGKPKILKTTRKQFKNGKGKETHGRCDLKWARVLNKKYKKNYYERMTVFISVYIKYT